MSALGKKRTLRQVNAMSALPPKADISAYEPLIAQLGFVHCGVLNIEIPSKILSAAWLIRYEEPTALKWVRST